MKKVVLSLAIILGIAGTSNAAQEWSIDQGHSNVNFKIQHLGISWVSGFFSDFHGTITADKADFSDMTVDFTIKTNSVNTGLEDRDKHLNSSDFFNTEKFATIHYTSTKVEANKNGLTVLGTLEMMGKKSEIKLAVVVGGIAKDPWGNEKAGLSITGDVDRLFFGIGDETKIENGNLMLSQIVKLDAALELAKKK